MPNISSVIGVLGSYCGGLTMADGGILWERQGDKFPVHKIH